MMGIKKTYTVSVMTTEWTVQRGTYKTQCTYTEDASTPKKALNKALMHEVNYNNSTMPSFKSFDVDVWELYMHPPKIHSFKVQAQRKWNLSIEDVTDKES